MKYCLSPREIPRAEPDGFPEGSGNISLYTPTRVTIQSFSITSTSQWSWFRTNISQNNLPHKMMNTNNFDPHKYLYLKMLTLTKILTPPKKITQINLTQQIFLPPKFLILLQCKVSRSSDSIYYYDHFFNNIIYGKMV